MRIYIIELCVCLFVFFFQKLSDSLPDNQNAIILLTFSLITLNCSKDKINRSLSCSEKSRFVFVLSEIKIYTVTL